MPFRKSTQETMPYELVFLNGIPYVADNLRNLYYYDPVASWDTPETFIHIGTLRDGAADLLQDWRERLEPRLAAWKSSMSATERGHPIPRAPKPSRSKRTAANSAKTKSAPSAEGGLVVNGTGTS